MIKIYRFISTTKAKDPKDKQPTHYLKAKENATDKESEFVASLWSKEFKSQDGTVSKFLSGETKSQWTDHTDPSKNRKGFVIVEEGELNKLLAQVKKLEGSDTEEPDAEAIEVEDNPF